MSTGKKPSASGSGKDKKTGSQSTLPMPEGQRLKEKRSKSFLGKISKDKSKDTSNDSIINFYADGDELSILDGRSLKKSASKSLLSNKSRERLEETLEESRDKLRIFAERAGLLKVQAKETKVEKWGQPKDKVIAGPNSAGKSKTSPAKVEKEAESSEMIVEQSENIPPVPPLPANLPIAKKEPSPKKNKSSEKIRRSDGVKDLRAVAALPGYHGGKDKVTHDQSPAMDPFLTVPSPSLPDPAIDTETEFTPQAQLVWTMPTTEIGTRLKFETIRTVVTRAHYLAEICDELKNDKELPPDSQGKDSLVDPNLKGIFKKSISAAHEVKRQLDTHPLIMQYNVIAMKENKRLFSKVIEDESPTAQAEFQSIVWAVVDSNIKGRTIVSRGSPIVSST